LFFTPGKEAGSFNISSDDEDDTKEKQIAKPAVACYCYKHSKEIQEARNRKKRLEERKRKFVIDSEEEEEESSDGSTSNASSGERKRKFVIDSEEELHMYR